MEQSHKPTFTMAMGRDYMAVQVESARADRMGISFGIDFSGSTNFVLLATAAALAAASQTSASTTGPAHSAATTAEGQQSSEPRTATVRATAALDSGAGEDGGRGDCGGDGTRGKSRDEEVASGRTPTVGGMLGKEGNMSAGSGVSARVSTGAFRRAIVARVTVRDPNVRGVIKVRSPSSCLVGVVP